MSISPRTIIKEACTRINLVPRRQAPQGDVLESGYRLLKGIVSKYNYDNLLAWTQNSIVVQNSQKIHIYDESDTLSERPDYDKMQHVHLVNVARINSIYLQTESEELHAKLEFVPASDFDKYSSGSRVFTYTQKSEGEWLIEIKPVISRMTGYELKIHYNEGIDFDLDTELFIPDNYVELLIVALAHKLALQFPRLDDAQMSRLENEVRVLVDNVRTPKAEDRLIARSDYFGYGHRLTQAELQAGTYL